MKLREPEKLALSNYLLFCEPSPETAALDDVLHAIYLYHSRSANLVQLRRLGSESNAQTQLWDRWQNLWSVLRNLHDRRAIDARYDTVIEFMRKAFPGSFRELVFDQLGPDRVTAGFVENGRRQPINASGVSDGHLQLLCLLTALFGEPQGRNSLLLFDEPEMSLHPHAIAVFADAVTMAADQWGRQVFVATHSPVLMSQFPIEQCFVFDVDDTRATRVMNLAGKTELQDLLSNYAAGSLYMSETLAPQSAGGARDGN